MRTGIGSRITLLLLMGAAALLATIGTLVLFPIGDRAADVAELTDAERTGAAALLIVGRIGAIVSVIGYLVLTELQAQTSGAFGSPGGRPLPPVPPSRSERRRPVGHELRVGRGDSWS